MKPWKKLTAAVAVGLCLVVLLCGCGAENAGTDGESFGGTDGGNRMEVLCFSAGKADAFLLTAGDSAVLIDCGEKGFGKEIVAYMEHAGIEKLDRLIVTHFDKDHVGGAAKVLKSVPVELALQSGVPKDSGEYENYLEALEKTETPALTVTEELTFTLDGAEYTVYPPTGRVDERDASNDSSLIVAVRGGGCSLLFTGDAKEARITEFLAQSSAAYDILKVPYHGRWQECLGGLMEAVKSSEAVITSSDEEPEDPRTVRLLEDAGARVWLTRNGAVKIVCADGKTDIAYTQ